MAPPYPYETAYPVLQNPRQVGRNAANANGSSWKGSRAKERTDDVDDLARFGDKISLFPAVALCMFPVE